MRYKNMFLSFFLALVFSFALFISVVDTVEASSGYTYRIKIALGNNEDAYFDEEAVEALGEQYSVSFQQNTGGKNTRLVIKELNYGDVVSLNVKNLIKISSSSSEEKYYVKGLRISGEDDLVAMDTNGDTTLTITGDETYVTAYGVGATVPYTVEYVDEDGNKLLDDDTLYAAVGEIVFVPARHIDGYMPDAYYKTDSSGISEGQVFTFVYSTGTTNVIYTEDYDYEYQYSSTVLTSNDNGVTTTRVRNEGTTYTESETSTSNNSSVGGNNAAADDAGDVTETIADDNTPTGVVDIADPDTPTGVDDDIDNYNRNTAFAIAFAIVAAVILIISGVTTYRKRKAALAVNTSSDKK